jgi:murein DD-endopeptidase MepM/ murein hydrolase activator NlpD
MPQRTIIKPVLASAALCLLLYGCGPLKPTFLTTTPHARYANGLRSAGLSTSALARAWAEAAQLALGDSVVVTLPFAETGYFPADRPRALGYRIRPKRGEQLFVSVSGADAAQVQVFLDVLEQRDGDPELRAVTSATDSLVVQWEAEKDRTYIVRVQPELLRSARLTITIRNQASVEFPVQGHTSKAVRSFFGNTREGGKRKHEGVDIFAPRGTPVVAVTNGWATAGNNNLGGKVVWLRNEGRSFYYAHLDSQYVSALRIVKAGDTLGTVGNTGNAEHTPPHLHFGVYASGEGAVDPFPFIHTPTELPAELKADTTLLSTPLRVAQKRVLLRAAPQAKAPVLLELPRDHALHAVAAHGDWFRVHHQGRVAYVASNSLEPSTKPLRTVQIYSGTALHDAPQADAPAVFVLETDTAVELLATDGAQQLVRVADITGWVLDDTP